MGSVIKRSALPTCLLLVGTASFIYGARFRVLPVTQELLETVEVEEERDIERKVPIPSPFHLPGAPPEDIPGLPPVEYQTFTEIVTVTVSKEVSRDITGDESERAVVQETTVGGIARTDSGDLKRTYRQVRGKDGKVSSDGPPGCPT